VVFYLDREENMGRWDWLLGTLPKEVIPAEPAVNEPQPLTTSVLSNDIPITTTRKFGEFNRSLTSSKEIDGRKEPFKRDSEYENSLGVRETLNAIDAREPIILVYGRAGTGKT
jgi:hypothetical protein